MWTISRSAPKPPGRSRARNGPSSDSICTASNVRPGLRPRHARVRRHGRRRHFRRPARHRADVRSPAPPRIRLFVSSTTADADLFVVCAYSPRTCGKITFQGAIDPHTPIGQGWLRASHRALDPALSLPYRPYHTHTNPQPLTTRRGRAARHRDLADLHRRAAGPPGRADGARPRLRGGGGGRAPVQLQERAAGLRPLPARRPDRPTAGPCSPGAPRCTPGPGSNRHAAAAHHPPTPERHHDTHRPAHAGIGSSPGTQACARLPDWPGAQPRRRTPSGSAS